MRFVRAHELAPGDWTLLEYPETQVTRFSRRNHRFTGGLRLRLAVGSRELVSHTQEESSRKAILSTMRSSASTPRSGDKKVGRPFKAGTLASPTLFVAQRRLSWNKPALGARLSLRDESPEPCDYTGLERPAYLRAPLRGASLTIGNNVQSPDSRESGNPSFSRATRSPLSRG